MFIPLRVTDMSVMDNLLAVKQLYGYLIALKLQASSLQGQRRSRNRLTSLGETSYSVSRPLEARGHGRDADRTVPFVTAAINILLRKSTDMCPSQCFTADK